MPISETFRNYLTNAEMTLKQEQFIERLWQKDPLLWTTDANQHDEIRNRLGWLSVPEKMLSQVSELKAFSDQLEKEGFKHAVVLGMGGSSLCPDVLARTFGTENKKIELLVLDSTDPEQILDIEKKIELKNTLFIVASKSGTTIEALSLYRYFLLKTSDTRQFVAITDANSPLDEMAQRVGFRHVFRNPTDIGGRYSALSYFGLVPAAILGIDLRKLLQRASALLKNPESAVSLGARMGAAALEGVNKLTLVMDPNLKPFSSWIEQLVAESTGKEGKGIVPVVIEPSLYEDEVKRDRFFFVYGLAKKMSSKTEELVTQPSEIGAAIKLSDFYDLGAEMVRWEIATAAAAAVMKINPFDQPNVEECKKLTRELLSDPSAELKESSTGESAPNMRDFLKEIKPGDYVAILAYLPMLDRIELQLEGIRAYLSKETKCAVSVGFGPRYLHSTGQLHKGGPPQGHFIVITANRKNALAIPEAAYSFAQLQRAQAFGDIAALRNSRRPLLHIDLPDTTPEAMEKLIHHFES